MRISGWSSVVCTADRLELRRCSRTIRQAMECIWRGHWENRPSSRIAPPCTVIKYETWTASTATKCRLSKLYMPAIGHCCVIYSKQPRSEEHTSELQSLMRTSYAVFCLKKKKKDNHQFINAQQ